jgi:hypothetical protein
MPISATGKFGGQTSELHNCILYRSEAWNAKIKNSLVFESVISGEGLGSIESSQVYDSHVVGLITGDTGENLGKHRIRQSLFVGSWLKNSNMEDCQVHGSTLHGVENYDRGEIAGGEFFGPGTIKGTMIKGARVYGRVTDATP